MIIRNNKTTSTLYKGKKEIIKRYKGTLVVYESFKNLIASGVPPLTLTKCKGVDLVDYKIYGDSIQDILSNNLFDKTTAITGGYVDATGMIAPNASMWYTDYIELEKEQNYIVSSNNYMNRVGIYDNDYNFVRRLTGTSSEPSVSFKLTGNEKYVRLSGNLGASSNIDDFTLKKVLSPTPDNPIEIESVGDKTKNLFNVENLNVNFLGSKVTNIDSSSGSFTITNDSINIYGKTMGDIFPDLEIGKTYRISGESNSNVFMYIYGDNRGVVSNGQTFTVTENMITNTSGFSFYTGTYTNMQITEVDVDYTNFEPYGYKIPVKVSGKNLIPYSIYPDTKVHLGMEWINNNDGTIGVKGVTTGFSIFEVIKNENFEKILEDGKTYTISLLSISGVVPNNIRILGEIRNKGTTTASQYISVYKNESFTFTVNKTLYDYAYIRLQIGTAGVEANGVVAIQLEQGTTPTAYEPYKEPVTTNIYLNEPLRKIGDYADYIQKEIKVIDGEEVITQKVVRNIKRVYADKNISYRYDMANSDIFNGEWAIFQLNVKMKDVSLGFSNKLKQHSSYVLADYIFWLQTARTYLSFNLKKSDIGATADNTSAEILELGKEYLANNLIYFDVIVEPTEETIELPNIPTHKGTTILSVDTTIQPSNLEVVYKGKEVK